MTPIIKVLSLPVRHNVILTIPMLELARVKIHPCSNHNEINMFSVQLCFLQVGLYSNYNVSSRDVARPTHIQ